MVVVPAPSLPRQWSKAVGMWSKAAAVCNAAAQRRVVHDRRRCAAGASSTCPWPAGRAALDAAAKTAFALPEQQRCLGLRQAPAAPPLVGFFESHLPVRLHVSGPAHRRMRRRSINRTDYLLGTGQIICCRHLKEFAVWVKAQNRPISFASWGGDMSFKRAFSSRWGRDGEARALGRGFEWGLCG